MSKIKHKDYENARRVSEVREVINPLGYDLIIEDHVPYLVNQETGRKKKLKSKLYDGNTKIGSEGVQETGFKIQSNLGLEGLADLVVERLEKIRKEPRYSYGRRAVATSIIIISLALIGLSGFRITGNAIANSVKTTNSLIGVLAIVLIILGVLFYKIRRR